MKHAFLEHVNLTVPDADATCDVLIGLFGWKLRWKGSAKGDGVSIHVGSESSYVALYTPAHRLHDTTEAKYQMIGSLNHIGIVVDDLDATEAKIVARGYRTFSHGDYEPGRRFYFDGPDGIEYEVVAYND